MRTGLAALIAVAAAGGAIAPAIPAQQPPAADAPSQPWRNPALSPRARADLLLAAMTFDEKLSMLRTHFPPKMKDRPADVPYSAGFHPGIPRLGIPEQRLTDASLGIAANQRPPYPATALPSGMAIAATWDPALARSGGALVAREARRSGYNILLGGGVNLVRDPRGGRSFEYLGEDALLAGVMGGEAIAGTQSEHVLSTVKHYLLNAQETGRSVVDARIALPALRESDLFAFQKAIEIGRPGSVMCSYNKINGGWGCENRILFDVLKKDLRYPGYTMSDWGGVHSTAHAVNAGLDQESGWEIGDRSYFGDDLRTAITGGAVSPQRIDDMVHRIVSALFDAGLFDRQIERGAVDVEAGAAIARQVAANGIVLLKNDRGMLPLAAQARSIAVIGRQADFGVLSGGGSSQVMPIGSRRVDPPAAAPQWGRGMIYHPSSPLDAIKKQAPKATVSFVDGGDPAVAASLASKAEVAVVFAQLWASEAMDASITLPDGQDALIAAVARANPNTIVVLQSNAAVLMPWLADVRGVVAAWYAGARGGDAIADMLFGRVDAAGRLPITFPASVDQLPIPKLPGFDRREAEFEVPEADKASFAVDYIEGADVGYRWFARRQATPLFPFGFGLSYTRFSHSAPNIDGDRVRFTVANTGKRAGTATPQIYVAGPGQTPRLAGWARVAVAAGRSQAVEVTLDPRRFAAFDESTRQWVVAPGRYRITVARFAGDQGNTRVVTMPARRFAVDWSPPRATR